MKVYYFYYWQIDPITLQRKMYNGEESLKPSVIRILQDNVIKAVEEFELHHHLDFLHCFFDEKTNTFYHVSRNQKTKDLLFQYYFNYLSNFLKNTL